MSNLAENVRKAALKKNNENQPTGTQTSDLQIQLATGATGKGQSREQSLKQSNIAEQIGMVQAREAQQAVAVAGIDAAAQIATKEAEAEVKQKEVAASNRVQEMQFQAEQADQMDQILSQMQFSDSELEDREDAFSLEQMAANLRLSDERYRHDLEMVGPRNRLDKSAEIAREAARIEIGDNTARLYDEIENQHRMSAEDRAQREEDLIISLDDAFNIVGSKIQDDLNASKISFVKDAATAGVSVAEDKDWFKSEADPAESRAATGRSTRREFN